MFKIPRSYLYENEEKNKQNIVGSVNNDINPFLCRICSGDFGIG